MKKRKQGNITANKKRKMCRRCNDITVCHKSTQLSNMYVTCSGRMYLTNEYMDSKEFLVFCNALEVVTLKRSMVLCLVGYIWYTIKSFL